MAHLCSFVYRQVPEMEAFEDAELKTVAGVVMG